MFNVVLISFVQIYMFFIKVEIFILRSKNSSEIFQDQNHTYLTLQSHAYLTLQLIH